MRNVWFVVLIHWSGFQLFSLCNCDTISRSPWGSARVNWAVTDSPLSTQQAAAMQNLEQAGRSQHLTSLSPPHGDPPDALCYNVGYFHISWQGSTTVYQPPPNTLTYGLGSVIRVSKSPQTLYNSGMIPCYNIWEKHHLAKLITPRTNLTFWQPEPAESVYLTLLGH